MECRIAQCDEIYSFEIFNTYELFRLSSLDATKPKQICQTNSMARLIDHWVFKFGFDSTNSLELKQYLEKIHCEREPPVRLPVFSVLFCSVLPRCCIYAHKHIFLDDVRTDVFVQIFVFVLVECFRFLFSVNFMHNIFPIVIANRYNVYQLTENNVITESEVNQLVNSAKNCSKAIYVYA